MTFSIVRGMRGCSGCGRRGLRAGGRLAAAVALALLLGAGPADAQESAPVQARPDTALAALRAENARLAARVDSLAESLRQHRYPESFLDSALEQQATFYGIFVTVVVAVSATLTWTGLRRDVRRSVADSRRAVLDGLIRVRRLSRDQRSTLAGMLAEQQKVVSDALESVRQVEDESRAAAHEAVVRVRRLNKDQQSATARMLAEQEAMVSDALASVSRAQEELRTEVGAALETHRQESAGWNARLLDAERFVRRAAGNAYVAIASVHGPNARGRIIAAHLLASGNFYAAGHDGRNDRVGAANLDAALRALNGIASHDRQTVAGQLERERARVDEAFELLRVHAGRDADDVVAEIRSRLKELSRTITGDAPGAPRAGGEPVQDG